MTPLRLAGLMVAVFVLALPATRLKPHGANSGAATSEADQDAEQGQEEKDDPVVDVLCLKGLEQNERGQFTKAVATFTKAIDRDPKYSYSYVGRGDAYRGSGDLDRAVKDYEEAARLDPENEAARDRLEDARKQKAGR